MNDQFLTLLVGGLIGYGGSLLQNKLEIRRLKNSEIRQEKIKIYSNVMSELGSMFMNPENFHSEISDPKYNFKFSLKLGRILAPARLVASDRLEEALRDFYEKELEWHKSLISKADDNSNRIAEEATKARMLVEKEMRRELKL